MIFVAALIEICVVSVTLCNILPYILGLSVFGYTQESERLAEERLNAHIAQEANCANMAREISFEVG